MVRRGLVTSREEAHDVIASGAVLVGGTVADKPSRLVAPGDPLLVTARSRFVSRGGDKLEAALVHFGVVVDGRRCLDAGASTGGFTDCLLQRGAGEVWAVDVGHGQLHPRLRSDPRVHSVERVNIRQATLSTLGGIRFDVVVADLSFIGLTSVVPRLVGELAAEGAAMVVLVKPQFEAGRAEAARARGVIKDPAVWRTAVARVAGALEEAGAPVVAMVPSPIRGASGNREFFVLAHAHRPPPDRSTSSLDAMLDAAVAAAASC